MNWQKFWLGAVVFFIVLAFSVAQAAPKPICRIVRIESVNFDPKTGAWGPDWFNVYVGYQPLRHDYYSTPLDAAEAIEEWIRYGHCSYESRRFYEQILEI